MKTNYSTHCHRTPTPFTEQELTCEMMAICGCTGQYDCDCTSVQGRAQSNLWYRHNSGDQEWGKQHWHSVQLERIRQELESANQRREEEGYLRNLQQGILAGT